MHKDPVDDEPLPVHKPIANMMRQKAGTMMRGARRKQLPACFASYINKIPNQMDQVRELLKLTPEQRNELPQMLQQRAAQAIQQLQAGGLQHLDLSHNTNW